MKLKKVAALTLSVLLTVGAMPMTAMAADTSAATSSEAVEGVTWTLDADSVQFSFNEDGEPIVTYKLKASKAGVEDKEETAKAESTVKQKANCEENTKYELKATISGRTFTSKTAIEKPGVDDRLGTKAHQWAVEKTAVTKAADCENEGKGDVTYKCSVCGATKVEKDVTLDKQDHQWELKETREEAGQNTEKKDGKFVLVDPTQDGTYTIIKSYKCKVCNETKEESEEKTIQRDTVDSIVVSASENIATDIIGKKADEVPAANLLELEDCEKDGSYTLSYSNGLGTKTITVPAHHLEEEVPTIEVKNKKQKDLIRVNDVKDKNGNVIGHTVINLTCNTSIEYYEVYHCTAEGCKLKDKVIRRESKTAAPNPDYHVINTEIKKTVDELKKADKALDAAAVEELAETVKADADFVKLSKNTATCTEDGTITATFLCKVCKAEVTKVELKTKKLGHDPKQVIVNEVAPTCEALGSYDLVWQCTRCHESAADDKHQDIKGIKLPRTKHSNETNVTSSGIGTDDTTTDAAAYIKFTGKIVVDSNGMLLDYVGKQYQGNAVGMMREYSVIATAHTNCEFCGNHEVELEKKPVLTVVSIKKQSENGAAGSITLKAEYTKADKTKATAEITVPYFTDSLAYAGRTEKQPVTGLQKDADGKYRYYVNDAVATNFTGLVDYNGGQFYVENGVLADSKNGLTKVGDDWYFLANGQVQTQHTGLAEYDGEWFYIVSGKLSTVVNGIVDYNGGKFLFAEGRLVKEYSGLYQDFDKVWYFLSNGQVQTQFTGVAMYDDHFFVVENGVFNNTYNGTIEYDGAKFNVVAGQLYDQVA